MGYVTFLLKTITICSAEKEGFNCKNNHGYGKLANFWLDNISKINYRILIVLSYILLGLRSKKN